MRGLLRAALVVATLLALPTVAMAYDIQVIIDSSAIKPGESIMVYFHIPGFGSLDDADFLCSFDDDGKMINVLPHFWGRTYTVEFERLSGAHFLVKGIRDALKQVDATTGYDTKLSHQWPSPGKTTSGDIGIYGDHIAY